MQFYDFLMRGASMAADPIHILLVEDDEIDVEAIERAFADFKIANAITVVGDGYEALDVLKGMNGRVRLPRPYIILLDLNMPRMNGLEFLRQLRQDPELKASVVFVLTTSNNEADLVAAYSSHVAGYFLKSALGQQVFELPQLMNNYWRMVELPHDLPSRVQASSKA